MSAHDVTGTVTRAHGERFERVALACSCGVPIPAFKRRHNGESPVRDAAGFPVATGNELRQMAAQARSAHARAGVSW